MVPLADPLWNKLKGGYGIPYDASSDLRRLEHGEDVWDRLWEELHHQGDIGEANVAESNLSESRKLPLDKLMHLPARSGVALSQRGQ